MATLLWLTLSMAFCALIYLVFVFGTTEYPDVLVDGESGILENTQAVVLFVCVFFSGFLAWRTRGLQRAWLVLVTVALFLLFGEEISWGQHLIGWASPAWFLHHNGQGETNLHNASWAVNDLPRNILRVAIFLGGCVYPLLRLKLRRDPPGVPPWLPPTLLGVAPALFTAIAVFANQFEWIRQLQDEITYFELSEVEELYMYLFFLTYLIGMWRKLKA